MRNRSPRRPVAVAALLISGLLPPAGALAAGPTFAWAAPQVQPQRVPAPGTFLVLARFAPGETLQRFYFVLQAGATEQISVLVPAGAPPVEITVLAPDGGEFSLPAPAQVQRVWLGPIGLSEIVDYPYPAEGGTGDYTLVAQPGTPAGQPYAVAGNWGGGDALGPAGLRSLLAAPVTWLRTLLWLWG